MFVVGKNLTKVVALVLFIFSSSEVYASDCSDFNFRINNWKQCISKKKRTRKKKSSIIAKAKVIRVKKSSVGKASIVVASAVDYAPVEVFLEDEASYKAAEKKKSSSKRTKKKNNIKVTKAPEQIIEINPPPQTVLVPKRKVVKPKQVTVRPKPVKKNPLDTASRRRPYCKGNLNSLKASPMWDKMKRKSPFGTVWRGYGSYWGFPIESEFRMRSNGTYIAKGWERSRNRRANERARRAAKPNDSGTFRICYDGKRFYNRLRSSTGIVKTKYFKPSQTTFSDVHKTYGNFNFRLVGQ